MRRKHHEAAFRRWVGEHQGILIRTAASFAPPQDRDDLLQEMMIALWHAIPAFRDESSPATFIYRVVQNCALSWHRSSRRRPVTEELHEDHLPDGPATDPRSEALHDALRLLPEVDRSLVLLYLEGLSYDEIAAVIGISSTNVGARLTRLRARLATHLETDSQQETAP